MKFFFLLFFVSTTLHANELSECGEYTIKGVIRPLKDGITIVVNEKTKSELKITTTIPESSQLAAFSNRPVTVTALLNKKFDGTKGFAEKIIKTEFRLPDPMNPKDTGINLEKKGECAKSL
ncbi:hypothetical protein SHI21_16750 [Bacteriovorax sp. PP10]|uniref:Uncharacterized protein n=1 Tax=Bacteriovorax antarcticus TaxID=3088717 RepID=A0ABU5VY51_9BACT|nr:hypothetical protein [Bacteriovorax sp. PP10]MEA9357882.1 hypothetical protein [Bacteriovorax sp. PP10]